MIPVIIPVFGKPAQIKRCVQHLEAQTLPVEVYIHDNNKENIFFTAAMNKGIRHFLNRDCEYMILLNQDMYLEPNAIENMVAFMDSNPACGIGSPLEHLTQTPADQVLGGGLDAFPNGVHRVGTREQLSQHEQIHWANGSCMIIRKTLVQEIGLLDKNLILIGSDSDYSFMARMRGWQVWRIGTAWGEHEHGVSGEMGNPEIQLMKINDMLYFGNKWFTGGLYRQMAFESSKYSPQDLASFMEQFQRAKERLQEMMTIQS